MGYMQAPDKEIVITITWVHLAAVAVLIVLAVVLWPNISSMLGPSMKLSTDRQEYRPGDEVTIDGWVSEGFFMPSALTTVVIEVRGEELIWVDQVLTDDRGHFTSSFKLREDSLEGTYEVYANTEIAMGVTRFKVKS